MGVLPVERLDYGSKPFHSVSLDLLGPILVKSMVNKRAGMKVWPLLIVCQATGAVHCEVMHSYGTPAFLLQWSRFVAIRGDPAVAVSDCGSQLKSSKNVVASSVGPVQTGVKPEGYVAAVQYLQELMTTWWSLWRQRALPHLLPYYRWEDAKRHRNLQSGDICLALSQRCWPTTACAG